MGVVNFFFFGDWAFAKFLPQTRQLIVDLCGNSYMELDVQKVNVKSKSEWFGGDKEELGAIRLETITLEVLSMLPIPSLT